MTVQRYRRKPEPPRYDDGLTAARYEAPLTPEAEADLLAVAKLNDDLAEVKEVAFPSGKRVLIVRWMQSFDEHPSEWAYTTVEPGNYLAYSPAYDNLVEEDDDELSRRFEREETVRP